MNFIAIDFETANDKRSSPCSVGLARVVDGKLTQPLEILIKPQGNCFCGFNISLHGITPELVRHQPEFPGVWQRMLDQLQGRLVVAHNAAFDMSVLRATLSLYELPWPDLEYVCSLKLAQAAMPDLNQHGLSSVCDYLGIDLQHHRAASDAAGSAYIALHVMEMTESGDLRTAAEKLGVSIGRIAPGSYTPCSRRLSSRSFKIPDNDVLGVEICSTVQGRLVGKRVAFTGTLMSMQRNIAAGIVHAAGGEWQKSVTRETDLLVVGAYPSGAKLATAASRMDRYGKPALVCEDEFLRDIGLA